MRNSEKREREGRREEEEDRRRERKNIKLNKSKKITSKLFSTAKGAADSGAPYQIIFEYIRVYIKSRFNIF